MVSPITLLLLLLLATFTLAAPVLELQSDVALSEKTPLIHRRDIKDVVCTCERPIACAKSNLQSC
jgi:hypothetical protein